MAGRSGAPWACGSSPTGAAGSRLIDPGGTDGRPYQRGDLPAIQALWEATGLSGPLRGDSETVVEATLAREGRFRILEESGRLVGAVWPSSARAALENPTRKRTRGPAGFRGPWLTR